MKGNSEAGVKGLKRPQTGFNIRKEKLFQHLSDSIDSQEKYQVIKRPGFKLQETYPTSIINNPVRNPYASKILKVPDNKNGISKKKESSNKSNKELTDRPINLRKTYSRDTLIRKADGKTSIDIKKVWLKEFRENFSEKQTKATPRDEIFKHVPVDDTLLNDTHMIFLNKIQSLNSLYPLFNKSNESLNHASNSNKQKDSKNSREAINDFFLVNRLANSNFPGEILESSKTLEVMERILKNQSHLTNFTIENNRPDLAVVSDMVLKMMGIIIEEYHDKWSSLNKKHDHIGLH